MVMPVIASNRRVSVVRTTARYTDRSCLYGWGAIVQRLAHTTKGPKDSSTRSCWRLTSLPVVQMCQAQDSFAGTARSRNFRRVVVEVPLFCPYSSECLGEGFSGAGLTRERCCSA